MQFVPSPAYAVPTLVRPLPRRVAERAPAQVAARRTDIQALRGVAVLLVLAYHARLGPFPRGFLGVDVFFVISGFLITGMVARDLDAGRFRFAEFYWRRAKRLLPAAYAVLAATSVAAALLLTPGELSAYAKQLAGALTFTANFVLRSQTNYFEEDAELKPLMHTWSLSLEEQFYLLLPLALWLTPSRLRRPAVLLALAASAAACFALAPAHPTGAFYLLPTRAWELLLGSAGALWPARAARASLGRSLAAGAAAAALVAIPIVGIDPVHPRLGALLVCVATLLLIRFRPALLQQGPPARALAVVGDLSYSLYLVHWPLLAFLRVVWLDAPPLGARLLALLAAALLSVLLRRTVEEPLHHARLRPGAGWMAAALVAPLAIAVPPLLALRATARGPDWTDLRRFNFGLGEACDFGDRFEPSAACRTAPSPRVLVWGDSYAMGLVPALRATDGGLGILQATRSECGPTLDAAAFVNGKLASARDCLAFDRSVVEFLRRSPKIDLVVLSSSFEYYVGDKARLLTDGGTTAAGPRLTAEAVARAVEAIRAPGRRVVLVAPPPTTGADLGGCVERRHSGLLVAGNALRPDCAIDPAVYRAARRDVIAIPELLSREHGVAVVRLSDFLCAGGRCRTEEDGTPLYLDYGHLTYAGAERIGREYRLLDRVLAAAR